MSLKLHLFGGARLVSDGTSVGGPAAQRRRLAVLALLALAPRRTATRERILALLWPDHSPDAARRLLSEAVYVLRRELGEGVVGTVGDELTLASTLLCDVDDFMAAAKAGDGAAATKTYGGPLLDGWYVRNAPDFEHWVEGERVRLAGLHTNALRDVAQAHEAANEWREAATWWQTFARIEPYNSTAVLRAASALANAGEPASGLHALLSHAELLRTELGVEPDAELVALTQQIRLGNVSPRRDSPPASAVAFDGYRRLATTSTFVSPAEHDRNGQHLISAMPPEAKSVRRRAWSATWALMTLAGIVTVSALVLGATYFSRARSQRVHPPGPESLDALDRRRIAVLYFEDRSEGGTLRYLSDGLTEYLINELSRVRGLHVTSPEAVRALRNLPIDSIARALHVRTIVRATVERSAGTVRVSARVLDASTQEQVGAVIAEAPLGEPFALEDGLSARIAVELVRWIGRAVRLAESRDGARFGARSNRALDLVLRAERLRKDAEEARVSAGRDSASVESARMALRRADSLLAESESIDRTWAVPAIERGWVAMLGGLLESGATRAVALGPGLGHVERAITLLESRPEHDSLMLARALYTRGLLRVNNATAVQTFRPESSMIRSGEEDLLRAIQYDSTLAGAWAALALPRWLRGDFRGVEFAAARALAADEYLEDASTVLGWAWHAANARGDRVQAERWCTRGRQQLPNDWHFTECELTIMRLDVAGLSGRSPDAERAWALVRELDRIDPAPRARISGHPYSPIFRRMIAAMVSASSGDRSTARATLAQARNEVKGNAELSTDLLYEAACLHFVLGERETGERELSAYIRARPDVAGFMLRDATVRRLRGLPS